MRYDLISDLHDCANRLEASLGELREMIMAQPLLIARVFTVGFRIDGLALTAVNAVIAGSAAMGAYEMTFAKSDGKNEE